MCEFKYTDIKKDLKNGIGFYDMKNKDTSFLSNFYICELTKDKIKYKTSEHYFQAMKFKVLPTDTKEQQKNKLWFQQQIRNANTPGMARILADQKNKGGYAWVQKLMEIVKESKERNVKIIPDWDIHRITVMIMAVLLKFKQNKDLLKKLKATGSKYLYEDSPRDSYWGIGKDKKGENMLGKILMCVRHIL